MINYFVEFAGTFIFLSVILSAGKPIPIAIALAAMILWGGSVSGGNYNPAVSFMLYMDGSLSKQDFPMYVSAQLAGAYVALQFHRMKNKSTL